MSLLSTDHHALLWFVVTGKIISHATIVLDGMFVMCCHFSYSLQILRIRKERATPSVLPVMSAVPSCHDVGGHRDTQR
jgi:hypothetical protein